MTWVNSANAALLTDLYEMTMAASYFRNEMNERSTFDLFVRHLPERRNFLIACGLEQALDFLERLRFDDEAVDYLRSLEMFDEDFLDYLGDLRFTGDVHAVLEGEAVFGSEPLLRVTAPLPQAQIVESFLLNCVAFQTMVASKAARVAIACRERSFVDFSLRRDHGADAALRAARASYIAGAAATSNVLAGKAFGIPVNGTMAHSYVMAFDQEIDAFRTFARDFPDRAVLLIDTFDVEEGARRAAQAANELADEGAHLVGVRIDSGDIAHLSRSVRKILDDAGLGDTQIFLSGDLDEYRIADLVDEGVPVDAFGVGTQMGVSGDAPSLGGVYKLVADSKGPRIKLSAGKVTLPGCKQVWRRERDGLIEHDVIALEQEQLADARPILQPVMRGGRRVAAPESLEEKRRRCAATLAGLPSSLKSLTQRVEYRVERSERLNELVESTSVARR
ncbi:MAG: nicotinate phosphoribosyltransferase [Actinomycetota bacterium]